MSKNRNQSQEVHQELVQEVETDIIQSVEDEIVEENVLDGSEFSDDEEAHQEAKPSGLGKFKVVHAVLGYKVGDEFEASHHSVRFQLKHKSIVEI